MRAGAKTEERIGRAPIDDRRATASGARERPVRNEPNRNARMDRIGRDLMERRTRDHRDLRIPHRQMPRQVVDAALEAPQTVDRKHRARDDTTRKDVTACLAVAGRRRTG